MTQARLYHQTKLLDCRTGYLKPDGLESGFKRNSFNRLTANLFVFILNFIFFCLFFCYFQKILLFKADFHLVYELLKFSLINLLK